MTAPEPTTVTPREFAERLGYKPNYGHQLVRDGRLVMAADGKRVLLAESIEQFKATSDPSKAGVADRHAVARGDASPQPAATQEKGDEKGPQTPGRYDFQGSKAKREHFAAMEAEASYRARIGELLEAADVKEAIAQTLTTLRISIEGLAHRLAPALAAEVDEVRVSAMLSDEIRHALSTAADNLAKLGR